MSETEREQRSRREKRTASVKKYLNSTLMIDNDQEK